MSNLSRTLPTVLVAITTTMLSAHLLAQTSSSSSSASSSSSSSGRPFIYEYTHSVCPENSDGEVVGQDEQGFIEFDPDNYAGSTVVFPATSFYGGPIISEQTAIVYANGSDFNRPMSLHWYNYVEQIDFPPTGSWDTWSEVTIPRFVEARTKLISLREEGGPNLKKIVTSITIDQSGFWTAGSISTECPTTPTPTPTPTPPPSQSLECRIGWPNVWNTGYVLGEITVTNVGTEPVQGWEVQISFEEPPRMINHWNSGIVAEGNNLIATNLSWNETMQPGQSATFGLQGNHDGSFVTPTCSARSD